VLRPLLLTYAAGPVSLDASVNASSWAASQSIYAVYVQLTVLSADNWRSVRSCIIEATFCYFARRALNQNSGVIA
jgi:hypothetical protein